MRILFATMQFARGYAQGTERYLSILSSELRRAGHETLFLAGDPEHRGPDAALGTKISDSPPVFAYPSHGWMAIRGLSAVRLEPLLAQLKPDLLHLVNPGHIGVGSLAAARRIGLPTVATIVDYWWLCPKHTLLRSDGAICPGNRPAAECTPCIAADRADSRRAALADHPLSRSTLLPMLYASRWLMRGVPPSDVRNWFRRPELLMRELNSLDGLILLAHAAQRRFAPLLHGPQTAVIYNGLEPEWFPSQTSGASLAETRPRRNPPVLGYAGALAPHKGVHLILAALKKLNWNDTPLRIAGGGEPHYETQLRAEAMGLQVEFLGRVAPADMPAYLRSLDLLIVPSTWPENLPMIVFEALACGTDVIGSHVDGIAEIVADENRLFAVNDAAALAERLRTWREVPTARLTRRVSRAAEMAAATEAFYNQVLSTGARNSPAASPDRSGQ